jgi:transcription termination/antitermination protein NusG
MALASSGYQMGIHERVSEACQQWYALRVRSNFEKSVSVALEQKGYTQFLPVYEQKSKWSDRVKTISKPLFSGYVFCQFDVTQRLPVLITPGVVSVVGCGKTPAPVTDGEIAAVQKMVDSGIAATPWPYCSVGQRVVIEEGPLVGVEGRVLAVRNSYRIVVSVSLLQRSISAEIDRAWIRPIPEPKQTIAQAAYLRDRN